MQTPRGLHKGQTGVSGGRAQFGARLPAHPPIQAARHPAENRHLEPMGLFRKVGTTLLSEEKRGGGWACAAGCRTHSERLSLPRGGRELGGRAGVPAGLSWEHRALRVTTHCPAPPRPGERKGNGAMPQGHANETGSPRPSRKLGVRPSEMHAAVPGVLAAVGLAQAEVPTSTRGDSLTPATCGPDGALAALPGSSARSFSGPGRPSEALLAGRAAQSGGTTTEDALGLGPMRPTYENTRPLWCCPPTELVAVQGHP